MTIKNKPKVTFRLYNQLNSSYFNLIEGNDETKQTKGLGIVLSKSEIALMMFLQMPKIKNAVAIDLSLYERVIVNCELISKSETKYRIDILIRFYHKNTLLKAIIIEAKSSNKNINFLSAKKQLDNYIDNDFFNELSKINKKDIFKIVLTKYESISNNSDTISMAWDEIFSMLYHNKNEDELINDYFNFLININGTMKFYEKEVYSIPSAKWSTEAIDEFFIYECPNKGKYVIKQKPLYITFRESGGGEMKKLYKIEDIIIFNPCSDYDSFMESDSYDENIKGRIRKYVQYMWDSKIWNDNEKPDEEKQFFILSEKNTIQLEHSPKPQKNNSFRAYYELADILKNKIVNAPNILEDM
jgi:hypothetical protein